MSMDSVFMTYLSKMLSGVGTIVDRGTLKPKPWGLHLWGKTLQPKP